MKKLLIILIIFSSCSSKKTIVEYKDRIITDTVTKTVKEISVERFTDTLIIKSPCDSLGNLKPFKQVVSTDQGKYTLTGANNVITAELDLNGYKKIWEKSECFENI